MLFKVFGKRPTLDDAARRPLRYFFTDEALTSGGINFFLVTVGPILIGAAAIGALPWGVSLLGAGMLVLLWRNHRRYRERLFFAIAERDRAGIAPPLHPDDPRRREQI